MSDAHETLAVAIADLRAGTIVRFVDAAEHAALERFASVVPELYAADRGAWAYGAFERQKHGSDAARLDDLVLVSALRVHVALRLATDPGRALIAVGSWQANVGAVVSAARAQRAAIEASR